MFANYIDLALNAFQNYSNGSFGIDWSIIPSYAPALFTKEDLNEQIKMLALIEANSQQAYDKQALHYRHQQLLCTYISSVSTNRKSLYLKILQAYSPKPIPSNYDALSNLNFKQKHEECLCYNTFITSTYDANKANYQFTINQDGLDTLMINDEELTYFLSPLEQIQKEDFYIIYWKAYHQALNNN